MQTIPSTRSGSRPGLVHRPSRERRDEPEPPLTKGAALSAYIFLAGVVLIVLSAFPRSRRWCRAPRARWSRSAPRHDHPDHVHASPCSSCCSPRPRPREITKQQIFGAGIVAILALFGIAWLADTFVAACNAEIVALSTDAVTAMPLLFAFALFILAALTTSQSATTRTLVPIGLAILPVASVVAMWQAVSGVLFLPANGTQLAAVAVDQTGSTKIGKASSTTRS